MLPEPQVPFPVSPDQRVRPDLLRLEGPAFQLDSEYPRYLQAKREQFLLPWTSLEAGWADPVGVQAALAYLANHLAEEHPEHYQTHFDLLGEVEKDVALALALSVQEDLVLMHGTRLEAAWVCFPSRWDPAQKVGKSFAEIHQPVPHSQKLQSAQHNVARAMSQKGPYVRYVWGLSYDPNLCQHPSLPRWEQGQTLYFRTERQVTLPIPELERSWFLIRVYNVPLQEVLTTPERKELLAQALRTMPPEHIAYKHMEHLIPRALEMCRD